MNTLKMIEYLSNGLKSLRNWLVLPPEEVETTDFPMDGPYELIRDDLNDVKKSIADLTTQKKRLEMQKRRLEKNLEKHDEQATEAIENDRDDLASEALKHYRSKEKSIEELDDRIQAVQQTQDELVKLMNLLKRRLEGVRTRRETISANIEAARASFRFSEGSRQIEDNVTEVDRPINTALERTNEIDEGGSVKTVYFPQPNVLSSSDRESQSKIHNSLEDVSDQPIELSTNGKDIEPGWVENEIQKRKDEKGL